jgi:hypothetical protein
VTTDAKVRRNRLRYGLGAMGLCLALVACSSGPSKISATQLNNDSAVVDTALKTYTSRDPSSLTSTGQFSAFIATTNTDLSQLRTAFNTWSHDLDHVDQSQVAATSKQAYPLMLAYRDALNDWITEQTAENTTAAACLTSGTALIVEACYEGAISKYSSTTVDTRVNNTRQQLTTALGG